MATPAQLAEKARQDRAGLERNSPIPPPLPPRVNSTAPPAYSYDDFQRTKLVSEQWRSKDPRPSSTHSLAPSQPGQDSSRRTLLLVYIHGFLGNETSFQSLPAHVHNLLSITLAETHVVHTKIYPRYKSRKTIDVARDDFSAWLEPHENFDTDVVLVGHSMGGILSAEVTLKAPNSPATREPFQHRILGTINFDTPFLGMHPGVVISGIGSLFRPTPKSPPAETGTLYGSSEASISSYNQVPSVTDSGNASQLSPVQSIDSPLSSPPTKDPFFNPPFPNDVRLSERTGLSSIMHFVNKHSDSLPNAARQFFVSHLEFGGCLTDYPGLKNRYQRLRALEDADELAGRDRPGYQPLVRRVRFINYYTASTGRLKPAKVQPGQIIDKDGQLQGIEAEMEDMSLERAGSISPVSVPSTSPQGQREGTSKALQQPDTSTVEAQMQNLGEGSGVQDSFQEPPEMRHIDSMPINDDEEPPVAVTITESAEMPSEDPPPEPQPASTDPGLPPIPAVPLEPEAIDLSIYTDKDSRNVAEKEQKRVMKAYRQAVKDRKSAIEDRKKLLDKRDKKARQERERVLKAEKKQLLKEEKDGEKRNPNPAPPPSQKNEQRPSTASSPAGNEKSKRDKKFCMLPPQSGGKRDACWVRVYMEGVDEVGAHCGVFFPGPQYESLVGDVGARIESWVHEDASRRIALEFQEG